MSLYVCTFQKVYKKILLNKSHLQVDEMLLAVVIHGRGFSVSFLQEVYKILKKKTKKNNNTLLLFPRYHKRIPDGIPFPKSPPLLGYVCGIGLSARSNLQDNSTMLIEAAKGGHTNVVQLLLDYPELCGSNADNNMSLATSSAAGTLTSTTATATQTCTIASSVTSDASKSNTVAGKYIVHV